MSDDVRMLLDGLEVESISHLKQILDGALLVERVYEGLRTDAMDGEFALWSHDDLIVALHRLGDALRGVPIPLARSYRDGFVDGVTAYAYSSSEPWAQNGVQYVGTTGRTLRQAVEGVEETYNFMPESR